MSAGAKTIMYNGVAVGEYDATGDFEADGRTVLKFLRDNGYETEVTQVQAMYHQAVAFADTAAQLYKGGFRGSARSARKVTPFIVNAAFSIELYLKTLAQQHGAHPPREHELAKLYAALPEGALRAIESVTAQCAAKRNLGGPPDLPLYLVSLNKAFMQWRYVYESESLGPVSYQQVIFAMEVLHTAAGLAFPRSDARALS